MKIGFMSDTHGGYSQFLQAIDIFSDCKEIIHTGDIFFYGNIDTTSLTQEIKKMDNIHIVRGNGDYFDSERLLGKTIDYENIIEVKEEEETLRIFATHSHKKLLTSYEEEAKAYSCQILAYGHTHVKELRRDGDLIIINPGSTTLPRDLVPSVGLLDTSANKIKLINLKNKKTIEEMDFRL